MKSFTLHLVVVFILGAQYQQMKSFCSSTSSSTAAATSPSYGRFNASNLSSRSSIATIQQATKTPRTIQRLIAGHIQHSSDTTNATSQLSRVYFRRKPQPPRNTYRSRKNSTVLKKIETIAQDIDDYYKDSALLEESNDVSNWDGGFLRSSAGAGKENQQKNKKKDESKKTLADQVKDGKYGLIENELFRNVPKRPGVISYLSNKEVPNDNGKNYGGLKEEEIWLAEDHLLVIKGGSLNSDDTNEPWEPIDNYQAPNRQIKIPQNPKVPPPFPVQFEDNEPIQFIGDHKFPFFYPNANESLPLFPENIGYGPSEAAGHNEKDLLAGPRSSQNATSGKNNYLYPQPFPPWLFNNESFANPFLNFGPPPQSPYPFDNGSDYIDEDDPSLYYPPPYSFVYKSNYSSPVEPGPLVPGIVLPPPPNAFARLEGKPMRTPTKSVPFSEILTKITDQRPKIIATTTTTESSTTTTTTTTTTEAPTTKLKEVYYVRPRPRPYPPQTTTTTTSAPPELVTFVPQVTTNSDSLSTGRPIYYEYFDARRVQPTQDTYTTPPQPPAPPKQYKPQQIYSTPIFKQVAPHPSRPQQPLRINKVYLPSKPYNYDDYLYITPKPEIRPNGLSTNFIPLPIRQPYKPQPSFDHEVDAIRQTLQYYKSQQLQQSHAQRTPKTKAVYEYSFDATAPNSNNYPSRAFTPPTQYDAEPFKPMVQYSRPVDDINGFKAIAYPRNDRLSTPKSTYYSTTLEPETKRLEVRVNDNTYNQPPTSTAQPIDYNGRDQHQYGQQNLQYSTPRTTLLSNQPWISIEKQVVQEIIPQSDRPRPSNHKDISRSISGFSRNIPQPGRQQQQPLPQFQGYYYGQPSQQRPNNRFQQYNTEQQLQQQQQPFTKHISSIRAQLNQYQQRPISLENDTYINNIPGRTINPDAEYINLPPRRQLFQQQRLPPPNRGAPQYHQPINFDRDVLVNYKLPLPPINPDSEYIQPQIVNRHPQQQQQQQQPIYHRPPLPQYNSRVPSNERPSSNIYYITPQRDVRYKKN